MNTVEPKVELKLVTQREVKSFERVAKCCLFAPPELPGRAMSMPCTPGVEREKTYQTLYVYKMYI